MKRLQRNCFIIATRLALSTSFASPSMAQSQEARELRQHVVTLYRAGQYAAAIPFAQRELKVDEASLRPDHPYLVEAVNNLAALYNAQRRVADLEPLLKRLLAVYEHTPGPDQRDLVETLNNLAALYINEARYDDAGLLVGRLVAMPDRPNVLTALNNLAALYTAQRRMADVEPLLKRLLAVYEQRPGSDQRNLVEALNNLAALYINGGRYNDARPLVKRLLAMPDSPDVVAAVNKLSHLYSVQGRELEAVPLTQRALAIYEKALGPNQPDVAITLSNLAQSYAFEGRYTDAEQLFKRAIAILERAPGRGSALATVLHNLADKYDGQGRYDEAEPLHKRSLELYEKALDHTNVVEALNGLVWNYLSRGRYAEAESLAKRSLAIREKTFGPDHPNVGTSLNYLGLLYQKQGRYDEAEPFFQRSLAIYEKQFAPDNPAVTIGLTQLIALYNDQHRYGEALSLVQRMMSLKTAVGGVALRAFFGAKAKNLISSEEAINGSLIVAQRRAETSIGIALNALAARFAAGSGRLADLVRQDQDLAANSSALEKTMVALLSTEASHHGGAEQKVREEMAVIAKKRDDIGRIFAREYPDYEALSRPEPLTLGDIKLLLADDEALIVIAVGEQEGYLHDKKSYVWALTKSQADWKELSITPEEISRKVSFLRRTIDGQVSAPFDAQASFELYKDILGPVENTLRGKLRLSVVVNGALTSLPLHVLATRDPAGKALKDLDWLIRTHAVTMLPSIASLKVLRGKSARAQVERPLIGFANPVFDAAAFRLAENDPVVAGLTASRGIRGTVANIAELKTVLGPLPETADELKRVAASVDADPSDLFVGIAATETRVKQEKLERYRIVYFATHGLLAGEVADFAKLNAEPALVLSLPEHPTAFDDGVLTASEIAQLKINADWVVLSACNTASGDKPGAEALSGLARAFFYAGGRSLLVSNWAVDSDSAVELMAGVFATLTTNPNLSHAEALQKSIVAMIEDSRHPDWADPKYWAPFIVLGEPAKP
jgi:CHAT domain-containing protein/Tfp pilus assembly protein PilF